MQGARSPTANFSGCSCPAPVWPRAGPGQSVSLTLLQLLPMHEALLVRQQGSDTLGKMPRLPLTETPARENNQQVGIPTLVISQMGPQIITEIRDKAGTDLETCQDK